LHFNSPDWLVYGVVASGLYLYFVGAVMQMFPNLGHRG
jgi:phosphatidylcholine synthase